MVQAPGPHWRLVTTEAATIRTGEKSASAIYLEILEESKAAEAILTDKLAIGGVENIDEHVFIRVTC